MLKYIAALALILGMAAGSMHCGHHGADRHGRMTTAPELSAA